MESQSGDIVGIAFCEDHDYHHAYYFPVDGGRPVAVEDAWMEAPMAGVMYRRVNARVKKSEEALRDVDV